MNINDLTIEIPQPLWYLGYMLSNESDICHRCHFTSLHLVYLRDKMQYMLSSSLRKANYFGIVTEIVFSCYLKYQ